MLYRWHKHSATGFAPSELLFGRKLGMFETQVLDQEDSLPLTPEAFHSALHALRQRAGERHEQAAAERARIQDARVKVDNQDLVVGTWLRVKTGTTDKLAATWSSIYTIARKARNGNYVLRDGSGVLMVRSYPSEMLMVAAGPETGKERASSQKILTHRGGESGMEYEVSLADGSSEYVLMEP